MSKTPINVEHDINIHLENKGASRNFFIFLFLMYAAVYMTKNCFSAALADIVAEGILTKSQTGFITALFYIVYAPLQILGGIVADKYSPERMIKIGLIGGGVANAVIFLNHNYYVMLVTWTLNAVVQFALWPSTYKIISSQLCRSDRTVMLFVISLASSLGLLFNYVIAAALPSWEYNFALSALLLFGFAVGIHIFDKRLDSYMKPDYEPVVKREGKKGGTASLLWKSGFFILLITVVVRTTVAQSVKTLSPVMLMESFSTSPSLGNILNTLIIISGILGTMLVKFVLYPKFIKNEIAGMMITMALGLVGAILLIFVPDLALTLFTLCVMSLLLTAPALFISFFNAKFVKYGKNGTAAGISNAGGSAGMILSSYGMVVIADNYDWRTVQYVWIAMIAISLLTLIAVFFMNRSFVKQEALEK